jgi:hypothetical protein
MERSAVHVHGESLSRRKRADKGFANLGTAFDSRSKAVKNGACIGHGLIRNSHFEILIETRRGTKWSAIASASVEVASNGSFPIG